MATLWVTGQPWMDYSSADYPILNGQEDQVWGINKAVLSARAIHFIKGLAGILKVDLPGQWDNWEILFGGGYI